jgi:hypothetical protein
VTHSSMQCLICTLTDGTLVLATNRCKRFKRMVANLAKIRKQKRWLLHSALLMRTCS